jgi:hypothetical protein
VQTNLTHALDSAVQAGDINAARNATKQIAELAASSAKPAVKPVFTNVDIKNALKEKAPWFGTDPRRSAKAVEFGKNMEPESFKSADDFAEAVIKAVDEEFKPVPTTEDEPEEREPEEEKTARKKTDAPSADTGRSATRARSNGPWTKLADAPKDVADIVKSQADKFTRNASKEQREKFISNALSTAYNAAQRNK